MHMYVYIYVYNIDRRFTSPRLRKGTWLRKLRAILGLLGARGCPASSPIKKHPTTAFDNQTHRGPFLVGVEHLLFFTYWEVHHSDFSEGLKSQTSADLTSAEEFRDHMWHTHMGPMGHIDLASWANLTNEKWRKWGLSKDGRYHNDNMFMTGQD